MIKKILNTLFGGGGTAASEPKQVVCDSEEYKGFLIEAAPMEESGQYRTAGSISKEVDGVLKKSRFIRADNSPDQSQAASHALAKGRQLVDEQGDRLLEREML